MKLLIYLIIGTVIQLVCRMRINTDELDEVVDSVNRALEDVNKDPEDEEFRKKTANWVVYGISSVILNILLWPVNIVIYLVSCVL